MPRLAGSSCCLVCLFGSLIEQLEFTDQQEVVVVVVDDVVVVVAVVIVIVIIISAVFLFSFLLCLVIA